MLDEILPDGYNKPGEEIALGPGALPLLQRQKSLPFGSQAC